MAMFRTRTGTVTTASTSTGTMLAIEMTTSGLARSLANTAAQLAAVRYLIQPLVILDISCRLNSNSRYLAFGIIFNSSVILNNLFNNSIFILADFRDNSLVVFSSKAAEIIKSNKIRQLDSIFAYMPSLSLFGILELIK